MIPVVLAILGVLPSPTAYWLAMAIGLLVLAADGLLFARTMGLRRLAALAVMTANLALGVVLVILKFVVTH